MAIPSLSPHEKEPQAPTPKPIAAARGSLICFAVAVIAILPNFLVFANRYNPSVAWVKWGTCALALCSSGAGFILAVVALVATKRGQSKRILWMAIAGVFANVIFLVLVWSWAAGERDWERQIARKDLRALS